MTAGRLSSRAVTYAALVLLSGAFLVPFLWMVSSSLKTTEQIFQVPPSLLPHPAMWSNYPGAVQHIPFWRYMVNTLIVCAGSVAGSVFSSTLVAYSFGILRWRGRNSLFKLLLATMLLPPQVTMVPVFVIFRHLGMIDTFWPLILPSFFGVPFFIFLMRQFYLGIPYDLVEAARIDGCSEWTIYSRIILPLSGPAIATVALFAFVWAWTDFMNPLIYLQDQQKFTLSLGLQQFQESHNAQWALLMAASTLITLPMIVLFFSLQRYFIEGIATTGLK
jgi:multiple sugar transport system permease protein